MSSLQCVIRIVALGDRLFPPGTYLKDYDPDAEDGRGLVEFARGIEEARRFANPREAGELRNRVSTVRPLRRDYKLNRPLSAYTIEILRLP